MLSKDKKNPVGILDRENSSPAKHWRRKKEEFFGCQELGLRKISIFFKIDREGKEDNEIPLNIFVNVSTQGHKKR